MPRPLRWCVPVLLLFSATATTWAQQSPDEAEHGDSQLRGIKDIKELSLEDLLNQSVKVATKTELLVSETPATVDVITREQIREWGYQSVADLLRHVVGFYVLDDHIIPNVAVRGVSAGALGESSIIKVMIDGHSVSFRSTSGNWLGPELIPISAVERVEILRGPASSLYGADAFLGAINIVTRSGEKLIGGDLTGGLNLNTTNPQSPGGDFDATLGSRKGKFELLAAVRLHSEDRSGLVLPDSSPAPFIPAYNAHKTVATGLDQTSRVGFLRLSYYTSRLTVNVSGWLSSLDRSGEFSPWSQLAHGFDSNGQPTENRVSLVQGNAAVNLQITATQRRIILDAILFAGGPTAGDRIELGNNLFYVRRSFGFQGVDSNLELQVQLPRNVSLVGGVGLISDFERLPSSLYVLKTNISASSGTQQAGEILESASTRQGNKTLSNIGAYVQALWTPKRYLTLTAGVRYDYHSIYGNQASGRVAAVVSPKSNVHIKLLYGSAFKAPSPLLLYAVPYRTGDVVGNPNLIPQFVHTIEGELDYRPLKALSLSTNLSYSFLLNEAEFSQQGVNQVARNIGRVNMLSWETRLDGFYKEWLHGYLSGELNHTVRDPGEVGFRADLIGSANVIYPQGILHAGVAGRAPRIPLRLTVEISYFSERRASEANILARGASYSLPRYLALDATLSTVKIHLFGPERETVLQVIGKNLIGAVGPDPGFSGFDYPLSPRMIIFQVRQQL